MGGSALDVAHDGLDQIKAMETTHFMWEGVWLGRVVAGKFEGCYFLERFQKMWQCIRVAGGQSWGRRVL